MTRRKTPALPCRSRVISLCIVEQGRVGDCAATGAFLLRIYVRLGDHALTPSVRPVEIFGLTPMAEK
ncbi:MAG: hypothetical protein ABI548_13600 [Polyangiaceae bacterium]